MIKITEVKDRNVLSEGRSSGIGFALLKKLSNTEFETVQPLSPCKDYLNEVVYTENTGIPSKACGLIYPEKLNIFDTTFYMGIEIMKTISDKYSYSSSFEADQKHLKNNYKEIEVFLNYFEDKFHMSNRTIITEAEEGRFLVEGPIEWVSSTWGISLYTLLLRCALVYQNPQDPIAYLANYSYNFMDRDLINSSLSVIKILLKEGELPISNYKGSESSYWSPHSDGFVNYCYNYKMEKAL